MPAAEEEGPEARQAADSLAKRFAFSPASTSVLPASLDDVEDEGAEAEFDVESTEETPRGGVASLEAVAEEGSPAGQDQPVSTPPRGRGDKQQEQQEQRPSLPRPVSHPPGLEPLSAAVTPEPLGRSKGPSSPQQMTGEEKQLAAGLACSSGSRAAALATPSTVDVTPGRGSSTDLGSPATSAAFGLSPISITLRRVEGVPLGLEVRPYDCEALNLRCLHVDKIRPGGMADAWNRSCGENNTRELRPGDRLISVNGATIPEDMRTECATRYCLKLEILRDPSQANA